MLIDLNEHRLTSVHANFRNARAILTPFKPNPRETARQSFTFDQFHGIETLIIDLDAHLIDMHAGQLLLCFELFSPRLSPTIAKPHVEVSLLTNLSELNFDHRFICAFGR